MLVRRGAPGDRERWLLVHKRDEHAVEGWDPDAHPRSVLTGRTNDEVRDRPERIWRSDLPAAQAQVELYASIGGTDEELAALDELRDEGTWTVFERSLRVTNLDKELFGSREGKPPVTKRELLR